MKILKKVLIIAISLIFFAYVAYQAFFKSPWSFHLSAPKIFFIIALTFFYSIGIGFVGMSWVSALQVKVPDLSMPYGLRVYFLAGIGKYLPGNLGHHVGRVWML
ncbi:MAG TPA: hypothetical protein VIG33_07690, partial [Pseudobdellovibrionaceae bacterium]